VIYEGFYRVYNKKAADRLGVVYTPNEIVRFMIESADWLCQKHFGKNLIDKGVEILDPATGTGTFICELLEHFRGQRQKLASKYKEERRDHAPLCVRQIGLVSGDNAAMLSWSSWRPHGESKLVQAIPWNHGRRQQHNPFSKTASDDALGD
jgi:hypothetical protein